MFLFVILTSLLAGWYFIAFYSKKPKAKKILGFGSLLTALFIILRVGPLRLLYFINLLLPILPFFKNLNVHSQNFNAKTNRAEMSESEALEILGLEKTASREEIRAAYKKLILKNHPDQGGSKYIAEKLIKAKDVLLKRR